MRTVSTGPTRTYGATATSSALVAIALILVGCQLFVIPLGLLPRGSAWGWLLLPIVLTGTPLWSLLHESIHGSLLRDRSWNDRLGRTLAIAYGAPYALLKAGHLLHHRFSRTPRERTEIFDPGKTTWRAQAPGYYLRLFGGLYLVEVSSLLLVFLPKRGWAWASRRLEDPETVTSLLLDTVAARRLDAFRLDGALIVLVHAAAFAAYGPHWWMLLAALLGRAFVVSVADNAYHYATPLDEPLDAMNLRLPRALETFILAFNLHGVHHRHPGLAWPDLRGAFLADGGRFDLSWWNAAVRQVRGPIPSTADRLRSPDALRPRGDDG